jgi:hypothetical protein
MILHKIQKRPYTENLGSVLGGVTVVAQQTAPVPTRLGSVNANLKPVRDFCESVPGPEAS